MDFLSGLLPPSKSERVALRNVSPTPSTPPAKVLRSSASADLLSNASYPLREIVHVRIQEIEKRLCHVETEISKVPSHTPMNVEILVQKHLEETLPTQIGLVVSKKNEEYFKCKDSTLMIPSRGSITSRSRQQFCDVGAGLERLLTKVTGIDTNLGEVVMKEWQDAFDQFANKVDEQSQQLKKQHKELSEQCSTTSNRCTSLEKIVTEQVLVARRCDELERRMGECHTVAQRCDELEKKVKEYIAERGFTTFRPVSETAITPAEIFQQADRSSSIAHHAAVSYFKASTFGKERDSSPASFSRQSTPRNVESPLGDFECLACSTQTPGKPKRPCAVCSLWSKSSAESTLQHAIVSETQVAHTNQAQTFITSRV